MWTTHLATAVTADAAPPTKRDGGENTDAHATTHRAANTNATDVIQVPVAPAAITAPAYPASIYAPLTLAATTTPPFAAADAIILHPTSQRKNGGSRSHTNLGRNPPLPAAACSVTALNRSWPFLTLEA